jgi:hypothetical protein
LRELQELLVVLELLPSDFRVVPRLQDREVLLGDARDEVRFGTGDVGVRGVELGLAHAGLAQRLPIQRPVE